MASKDNVFFLLGALAMEVVVVVVVVVEEEDDDDDDDDAALVGKALVSCR
tara:strand:+ start:2219 stop:2368 length:150 start_codon:yes stop_codon:yes gene_type:complete